VHGGRHYCGFTSPALSGRSDCNGLRLVPERDFRRLGSSCKGGDKFPLRPRPSPIDSHTGTPSIATEVHSHSTIKPTTVQGPISPLVSETNVVSLIPDALSKRFALLPDNLDSSKSSPTTKLAPCASTSYASRSGHPVAARSRDCDFELSPRRRVRFG
jgi:hypothetical protein